MPNEHNAVDRQNFSRYYPKRLPAEVLFDAVNQLTGAADGLRRPARRHARRRAAGQQLQRAAPISSTSSAGPKASSACECERTQEASLAQSLHLLNAAGHPGQAHRQRWPRRRADEGREARAGKNPRALLTAFSRDPRADEVKLAEAHLAKPRVDAEGKPLDSQRAQTPGLRGHPLGAHQHEGISLQSLMPMRWNHSARSIAIIASLCCSSAFAQLAGLPTPRLLTVMPMGGQAGSTVEVAITGADLEEANELRFSIPKITAKPKTAADGKPEANKFVVTIAADAPRGVHEVRAMTRFGVSSPRAFAVGGMPEITREKANTSIETALELKPNSICNAAVTAAAADYYSFQAAKGKARRRRLRGGGDRLEADQGAHHRRCARPRSGGESPRRCARFHPAGGRQVSHQGSQPHLPRRRRSISIGSRCWTSRTLPQCHAARDADGELVLVDA